MRQSVSGDRVSGRAQYPPWGIEIITGSYNVRNNDFALIVYVHKDNPVKQLSLAQVDAILGCQHRRGH